LPTSDSLGDHDGCDGILNQSRPPDVPTDDTDQVVVHFVGVNEHSTTSPEQVSQVGIQVDERLVEIVETNHGSVQVLHTHFHVAVKVVWCGEHRHHVVKMVFAQPDDFLLAANWSVIGSTPTRALTQCEPVSNDPREIPWLNSESPLASESRRHDRLPRPTRKGRPRPMVIGLRRYTGSADDVSCFFDREPILAATHLA